MYVACSHADEKRVRIFSSDYRSGFSKVRRVRLPADAILSNSFTLMDTSESQVFLFVENHGLQSPFGNLYISDARGLSFSLSMENVIKGNAVDFEKVASLDGSYILNKYITESDKKRGANFGSIQEFDESDMIAYENKKSRLGRPANSDDSMNRKQR